MKDKFIKELCIRVDEGCPPTDHVLALKIMIEQDEQEVWKGSNVYEINKGQTNQGLTRALEGIRQDLENQKKETPTTLCGLKRRMENDFKFYISFVQAVHSEVSQIVGFYRNIENDGISLTGSEITRELFRDLSYIATDNRTGHYGALHQDYLSRNPQDQQNQYRGADLARLKGM